MEHVLCHIVDIDIEKREKMNLNTHLARVGKKELETSRNRCQLAQTNLSYYPCFVSVTRQIIHIPYTKASSTFFLCIICSIHIWRLHLSFLISHGCHGRKHRIEAQLSMGYFACAKISFSLSFCKEQRIMGERISVEMDIWSLLEIMSKFIRT